MNELQQTISDSTADYVITLNTPTGARSVELHQGGLGQNGDLIVTIWDASDKGAVIDQVCARSSVLQFLLFTSLLLLF